MNTVSHQTVSSNQFSNSLGSSESDKYGGLLPQSTFKRLRNGLFNLHSYVQTEAPKVLPMHAIVSVFRLAQLFGPALLAPYNSFWDRSKSTGKFVDVLSILFHFCPCDYRLVATTVVSYTYFAIMMAFLLLLVGSSFYYKANATLPAWVPMTISIFIHTVGYLLHPMALEISSEMVGRLIANPSAYNMTERIVEICLVYFAYLVYLTLIHLVFSTTIVFRPSSLMTIQAFPQSIVFETTCSITIALGIGSQLSKYPRMALYLFSACSYFFVLWGAFRDGGFIKAIHARMISTLAIVGGCLCISVTVLDYLNIKGSEIVLFVTGIFAVAVYFIVTYILSAESRKSLQVLDLIESDQAYFENVKSLSSFARLVLNGFEFAHPVCISWQVFRYATDKWPNDIRSWLLFAKFVAIYPEETQTLAWILHQINSLHIKGSVAKHIISEVISLIRQRESNLSPELKRKLNQISKSVTATKHKLRHIWDLVIQGNTGEMESIIGRTERAISQAESEYLHILHQYPNCRFVVRSYARFKYEVCADHESFKEWAEKAKLMQRGLRVHVDQAHELGTIQFQNIPDTIKTGADTQSTNFVPVESESQLIDLKQDDESAAVVSEQITNLRRKINALTIPAVSCNVYTSLIIFFVLFVAPIIIISTLIYSLSETWEEPLTFLSQLSLLRGLCFHLPSFGLHAIFESLNLSEPYTTMIDTTSESPPESLGSTFNISLQLTHLLTRATECSQNLTNIQSYDTSDSKMTAIRDVFFSDSVNYTTMISSTSTKSDTISIQTAIANTITKLEKILSDQVDSSIFNDSTIVDPSVNAPTVASSINTIIEDFVSYMSSLSSSITINADIIICVVCVISPGIIVGLTVAQSRLLNRNKLTIYKCLTSIPKNHVSVVADVLKVMKKDQDETSSKSETDTELNKQEENMIKVFTTASDTSIFSFSGLISTIIGSTILVLLNLAATIVLGLMYLNVISAINKVAPHINTFLGAISYQAASVFGLYQIASISEGYKIHGDDSSTIQSKITTYKNLSETYFHTSRYGSADETTQPFSEFDDGITKMNEEYACSTSELFSLPSNLHSSYKCFSPELIYLIVDQFIDYSVQPYSINSSEVLSLDSEMVWNVWDMEYYFAYDKLFYPIFSEIIADVVTQIDALISPSIIAGYCILAASFFVCIFLLVKGTQKERELKYAMSLLLHYQPSVILQIPLITQVLSGNFDIKSTDTTSRDAEFFDAVIEKLPDATIVSTGEGQILSINQSAHRLFEVCQTDTIQTFFRNPGFEKTGEPMLQPPPKTEEATYKGSAGTDYLTITSMSLGNIIVYTARNITQTKRYNTLIEEELAKSEKLLQSILPPKLVPRVQSGEKNISFSVQSASIVFIDIVEFTPWCAANTATKVMQTLNALFKSFDAIVANLPTMTKIKCIGDCYMAAGGIFSEVNQPTVHATEAVQFGIQAIDAIEVVNKEMGTNLQIRVGINTGGPIVGGVIGCAKPTFEILGPAINMAQQMEHHGIPMVVHVSRSVYELIYGVTFNIKERGQVEIKNGTVVTYIVTKK